jgi:hypothetical protein
VGDALASRIVDNSPMTIEMLGRMQGQVDPVDMGRLARCCTHARLPQMPAAAGYRYYDLGGAAPSFYLRRFRLGTRTAAVSLVAPVELSSGLDAERGAPALAQVVLSVGARQIPWDQVCQPDLVPGDSALLARAALQAVLELDLLTDDECPLCSD